MMTTHLAQALHRPAALAGGVLLVTVALLTVLDVALRYALNRPLAGTFELTQLAMAGIAFLGLGQAQQLGQHITIDLLYELLPAPGRRALDLLAHVLSLLLAVLITWQLLAYLARTRLSGEVTSVLSVPVYPAIGVAGAGFGLFALALLADVIADVAGRRHPPAGATGLASGATGPASGATGLAGDGA